MAEQPLCCNYSPLLTPYLPSTVFVRVQCSSISADVPEGDSAEETP